MIRATLPPLSNRESWADVIEFVDADTGVALDLTSMTAQILIRSTGSRAPQTDYWPFSNTGSYPIPQLLATTENGKITFPESDMLLFAFSEADMRTLCPGQYQAFATATRFGKTI